MNIIFSGCIQSIDFYDGNNYTVLAVKGLDDYSNPSRYRIKSSKPFGSIGQVLDVTCRISGSVFPDKYIDKETGQTKSYIKSPVYFEFVSVNVPNLKV